VPHDVCEWANQKFFGSQFESTSGLCSSSICPVDIFVDICLTPRCSHACCKRFKGSSPDANSDLQPGECASFCPQEANTVLMYGRSLSEFPRGSRHGSFEGCDRVERLILKGENEATMASTPYRVTAGACDDAACPDTIFFDGSYDPAAGCVAACCIHLSEVWSHDSKLGVGECTNVCSGSATGSIDYTGKAPPTASTSNLDSTPSGGATPAQFLKRPEWPAHGPKDGACHMHARCPDASY